MSCACIYVFLISFPAIVLEGSSIDIGIRAEFWIGGDPVQRVLVTAVLISGCAKLLRNANVLRVLRDTEPPLVATRAYDCIETSGCFQALVPHWH